MVQTAITLPALDGTPDMLSRVTCFRTKSMYLIAMEDLPPIWPRLIRGTLSGLVIGLLLVGLLSLAE